MAGARKKPGRGGKYRAWFIDAVGKQKHFTGTRSRSETLRMAQGLEDEHPQVRLGYRQAPRSAAKHRTRSMADASAE